MSCTIGGFVRDSQMDIRLRRSINRMQRTDFGYGSGLQRDPNTGNLDASGVVTLGGLTAATQTFVNDTNVTMTSSGSSHTLGWSGLLAEARGGSKWTDNSGTLHPNTHATENVAIGGATTGAADIALNADGSAVFNEAAGGDIDFRVESAANTHMFFLDGSANRIGMGGAAPTDGTLHVQTANTGGSFAANGQLDDIVVENSGNCGITIGCPNANLGRYGFGNDGDDYAARLEWDYTNSKMILGTSNGGSELAFETGDRIERMRLHSGGELGIGTGTDAPDGKIHIREEGGSAAFAFETYRTSGNHNKFDAYAARGNTKGAAATLSAGDAVIEFRGLGYNAGGDFENCARFMFEVDNYNGAAPSLTSMPGRINFQTVKDSDGTYALNTRLTINHSGHIQLSCDNDVGTQLLTLDQNDADKPFIDFQGTTGADTTSSISTLTTSGAVQGHIQIEINGTKRFLAILADPS